jgi:alpha-tubulin suppressor-like RCC1 family protein
LTSVTLFAARDYHDLAVKSDGSVWAWGSGGNGELGNGLFADSAVPVRVLFPPGFSVFLPLIQR